MIIADIPQLGIKIDLADPSDGGNETDQVIADILESLFLAMDDAGLIKESQLGDLTACVYDAVESHYNHS